MPVIGKHEQMLKLITPSSEAQTRPVATAALLSTAAHSASVAPIVPCVTFFTSTIFAR